jgi:hypothetical protein
MVFNLLTLHQKNKKQNVKKNRESKTTSPKISPSNPFTIEE